MSELLKSELYYLKRSKAILLLLLLVTSVLHRAVPSPVDPIAGFWLLPIPLIFIVARFRKSIWKLFAGSFVGSEGCDLVQTLGSWTIVLAGALIATLLIQIATLTFNSMLDFGSETFHRVRILNKSEFKGDYYIDVASWHNGCNHHKLSIQSDDFHHAIAAREIDVITKPGALGVEWLVSYTLVGK